MSIELPIDFPIASLAQMIHSHRTGGELLQDDPSQPCPPRVAGPEPSGLTFPQGQCLNWGL